MEEEEGKKKRKKRKGIEHIKSTRIQQPNNMPGASRLS